MNIWEFFAFIAGHLEVKQGCSFMLRDDALIVIGRIISAASMD